MIQALFRLGDASSRAALIRSLALTAASALLMAAVLVLIVPFVARLLSGDPRSAVPIGALMAGLGVLFVIVELTSTLLSVRGGGRHVLRMHALLADRVVRIPLGYFTDDRAGGIAAIASRGVIMAANAPGKILRSVVHGLVVPALCTLGLIAFEPLSGALASIGALAVYATYRWVHRVNHATEREVDRRDAEGSARVLEYAQRQPAVRAAGPDSLAERAARQSIVEQFTAKYRSESRRSWANNIMSLIVYVVLGCVVGVATARVLAGQLEYPTYAGVVTLLMVLAAFTLRFLPFGRGLELAKNAIIDLDGLLDQPLLPEPATPAAPSGSDIEFDDVDFSYDGVPVLTGVSLRIAAGRTTAIVGPSGSGKSTVLRLLARFWDVDGGAVRIGGADVRDLGTEGTLRRVSTVFQDVYVFEDTLRENIRMGRPDADDDEVAAAATLAGVDEIAARLPLGLDTPVSEGGGSLSGGERQRLSIARAILKDAPIMLLDEATAALDIENERLVQRSLAAMAGERTIVLVAHRLSFVRDADHIVVLDGRGGVDAQGTHEELLGHSELYARFCAERAETGSWRVR
ncbi:ABC transporter ATP-binding protein [Microbacterium sp.]|uniref:ABC transporter ATP-binding protein n=1 Tax=Microbacterium sp. TaxID=51671 RepID=UPI0032221DA3